MSKFCTTCGATLDDNATFCTSCGTPQPANGQNASPVADNSQTPAASAAESVKNTFSNIKDNVDVGAIKDSLTIENIKNLKNNPNKNTIIGLCAIGVVAIIVIVIILVLLLGGGYKKPIDNVIKAYTTGEGKYMVAVMCKPEQEWSEEKYVENSKKYDSLEEYFDAGLESTKEALEDKYGEGFKIKYSVDSKKELSDSKLKAYKNSLKDEFDEKVEVTAGYKIDIDVTWKGPDDEDEDDRTITVLKVDGDWILASDPSLLLPSKLKSGSSSSSDYDALTELEDLLEQGGY